MISTVLMEVGSGDDGTMSCASSLANQGAMMGFSSFFANQNGNGLCSLDKNLLRNGSGRGGLADPHAIVPVCAMACAWVLLRRRMVARTETRPMVRLATCGTPDDGVGGEDLVRRRWSNMFIIYMC